MALLVLIVLGTMLGWLASILMRSENPSEILQQMGLGLVAALIAGLIANQGVFMGGLSLLALGAGCVAAILMLGLYHGVLRRGQA